VEDIVSKMIFEALQIRENPDIYIYMEINIEKEG
tara:strand:- start:3514 stop:3615 length:102 start_codon:yes stop_codon:yes gene_type:complete